MDRWFLSLALVLLLCECRDPVLAESDGAAAADVIDAAVPFYPPLARVASVQGVVIVEVTTQGRTFGSIKLISGHPLLSPAAIANLRTWVLAGRLPASFRIAYRYKIAASCKGTPTVTLKLPTDVSICSPPYPPIG
jgi:hypothetical protein